MATTMLLFTSALFILCTLFHAARPELILTVVNNCPFTVYPAIQPNAGHAVLEKGGFPLQSLTHRSFRAPDQHWGLQQQNRMQWPRWSPPATLAQITLHHGHKDFSSYGVSLVDGFNLPMTVTPHEGKGVCPVVGCKANLLATCPDKLKLWSPDGHGHVVGCKSGCQAFGTDELCCRNHYNSPQTCRASSFSEFFKHACPATFTYAHDSPSLMHECSSPRELKVIFCH
ncbi:unnamed protein product [Dovyalis caffra]|uniref:Osmotin-like protein n=1 Tax=Dovyalis caffra TaxID=77055 RepID=A0AAV1RAI0_9ROSI|nr:unnamed protein product [Dovyalis caffra]